MYTPIYTPSTQSSEIFPMWTVSQPPETLHAGTLTPTGSIVNSLTVFQFFSDRIRSTWDFWEWFFALYFSYQECYIQRKIISINEKSRKQATSNISSYRLICKVSWKVLKWSALNHKQNGWKRFFIKPVFWYLKPIWMFGPPIRSLKNI